MRQRDTAQVQVVGLLVLGTGTVFPSIRRHAERRNQSLSDFGGDRPRMAIMSNAATFRVSRRERTIVHNIHGFQRESATGRRSSGSGR